MFSSRYLLATRILLVAAISIGLAGCAKDAEPPEVNHPPTVELTGGPVEGALDTSYRVRFEWTGNDPDDEYFGFQYLLTNDELTGPLIIDENIYDRLEELGYEWTLTPAFGVDLVVAADRVPDLDEPADSIYFYEDEFLFHAQHTFFLRAGDLEGAVTPVPVHRSFTAVTVSPEVDIIHPIDTGQVGGWDDFAPSVLFRWTGLDPDGEREAGEPDSSRIAVFRYEDMPLDDTSGLLLDLPDNSWSQWRAWETTDSLNPHIGGTKFMLSNLDSQSAETDGRYLIFVQAKDKAGAVTSHFEDGRNLRKFRVLDSFSPTLRVHDVSFGQRIFHSASGVWDLSVYEGFQLELEWEGSADHYGCLIRDYRYGWNLVDPEQEDSWSQWSVDHISINGLLNVGEQSFHIQCRDYAGNITTALIRLHVLPVSMEYDLAFIDDYDNGSTEDPAFGWPAGETMTWRTYTHDDADQAEWWNAVLADYTGYVPARDHFRVTYAQDHPPMEFLGEYRRVIWEVKESSPGQSALARISRFMDPAVGAAPTDYLSLWLSSGGQMLLCGSHPVEAMLPTPADMVDPGYERRLPLMFDKALTLAAGPAESSEARDRFLPRRWLGVESVTAPVDADPRYYEVVSGDDFETYQTHWGMAGAGFTGESTIEFGDGTGWSPPDTLRFSADVYQWLANAGPVFNSPDDGCEGAEFFGLAEAEVYNWEWFTTAFVPPVLYDDMNFLPMLSYLPADPTTRWGAEPAEEHCFLDEYGEFYREADYALPSYDEHWVGLVGMHRPEAPSVVLGFPPFYLDEEDGRGLIGHVLTDIMGLTP